MHIFTQRNYQWYLPSRTGLETNANCCPDTSKAVISRKRGVRRSRASPLKVISPELPEMLMGMITN